MAISEQARRAMHEKLDEVLGPKVSATLMEEVSSRDLGHLATKVDLDHLAELTRRDITDLEGRIDARFENLEGRMDARFEVVEERIVRVEGVLGARIDGLEHRCDGLGHRFDAMETRLSAQIQASHLQLSETLGREVGNIGREFAKVYNELGNVYKELAAHTRTTVFACIAAVITSSGLAFAAARL